MQFSPDGISSLLTVEVYLPKNLRNYGALIELLSETLEFTSAKRWMLDNMHKFRAMQERTAPGRVGAFFQTEGSYEAVKAEGVDEFASNVTRMERTIVGYSVYEVDGAFQSANRGRVVPLGSRWNVDTDEDVTACVVQGDLSLCVRLLASKGLLDRGFVCTLPNHHLSSLQDGLATSEFVEVLGRNGCEIGSDCELVSSGPGIWVVRWTQPAGPERALAIEAREHGVVVYEFKVVPSGDDDGSYGIFAGDASFWLGRREEGATYHLCPAIRLLEERTCVIRFMAETRDSGGLNAIGSVLKAPDKALMGAPSKKLSDTIRLLSYYFVYNLGARVGIEDEIWMVYNSGSKLFRWKKDGA
jgi:hypothetical protein